MIYLIHKSKTVFFESIHFLLNYIRGFYRLGEVNDFTKRDLAIQSCDHNRSHHSASLQSTPLSRQKRATDLSTVKKHRSNKPKTELGSAQDDLSSAADCVPNWASNQAAALPHLGAIEEGGQRSALAQRSLRPFNEADHLVKSWVSRADALLTSVIEAEEEEEEAARTHRTLGGTHQQSRPEKLRVHPNRLCPLPGRRWVIKKAIGE